MLPLHHGGGGTGKRILLGLRQQEVLLFLLQLLLQYPVYDTIQCVLQEEHKRDCVTNPCLITAHHPYLYFENVKYAAILNHETLTQ